MKKIEIEIETYGCKLQEFREDIYKHVIGIAEKDLAVLEFNTPNECSSCDYGKLKCKCKFQQAWENYTQAWDILAPNTTLHFTESVEMSREEYGRYSRLRATLTCPDELMEDMKRRMTYVQESWVRVVKADEGPQGTTATMPAYAKSMPLPIEKFIWESMPDNDPELPEEEEDLPF